jgi:Tol biopolymer transport system component
MDVFVLSLDNREKPILFQKNATNPKILTGRALVSLHTSSESGRPEVYVRPFQPPGGKTQISNDGGTEPVWSSDGRELFYLNGDKTMAIDLQMQPTSPDGNRFLKVQATQSNDVNQIDIVLIWTEELKQRVPAK